MRYAVCPHVTVSYEELPGRAFDERAQAIRELPLSKLRHLAACTTSDLQRAIARVIEEQEDE